MSRVGRLALCLGLALATACAGMPGQAPRASDEERRAYGEAIAKLPDHPEQAESALEAFAQQYPSSALTDDALVRLAELAEARGDRGLARDRYRAAARAQPGGDRADAARVRGARLEHALGNDRAAADALRGVRASRLSAEDSRLLFRLHADLAQDPVEKLRWLAELRAAETDPDAVALIDTEIDETALPLGRPDLIRAAEQIGETEPAARLWLEAARLALDQGDLDAARDAAKRAARLPLAPAYQSRQLRVAQRLALADASGLDDSDLPSFAEAAQRPAASLAGARGTIGVVLPLSGRFASFGEESLQGVLVAAGVFGGEEGGARAQVVIRDSAGRPEQAARAVRELADAGAVAIVGPILRGESEAAAEAAESAGVPLLVLTAHEEVTAGRPHVFRVRTRPGEEVEALADHAVREVGARRFAILYPRDAYGRGLRHLFWEAVERRGGEVVAVASYDPDATDFGGPIRRLLGFELLTDEEKAALKAREALLDKARRLPPDQAAPLRAQAKAMTGPEGSPLPPIVDFDALFLPESHENVVLIAPQLAFHEAVGMTLLGPSGWYAADLAQVGREHVEGARFTAHFFPDSEYPVVRDFTARYDRAYAARPDVFAAQAYDAASLVLEQLARGRSTREDVREGLTEVVGHLGVTGVLTMRADGSARKRPFLLQVSQGKIQQVP
jgi:ABC-type branched-subunit amino acid transport system substrate-binding protein